MGMVQLKKKACNIQLNGVFELIAIAETVCLTAN